MTAIAVPSVYQDIFDPSIIPDWYKKQLRAEIMQDMVRDGANEASIKICSEIQEAETADPVYQFCMKLVVESWLISHGYRMIPDGSVSASIRVQIEQQMKRRNASVFIRIFDAISQTGEKTRTQLIEENEALAAFNEALKTESAQIKLDNAGARAQAAGIVNTASEKSTQIISGATTKAESILSKSRKESNELITNAQVQAQEIIGSAMRDKERIVNEINTLKDLLRRHTVEVEQKQNLLVELNANPELVEAYRNLNNSDQQILDEIRNQIAKIKYDFSNIPDGYYNSVPDKTKVEVILQSLLGFREHILENLCAYEDVMGSKKRVLLMPSLIIELKKAAGNIVTINVGRTAFSKTFFSRFLRHLERESVTPERLLRSFTAVYDPFLASDASIANKELADVFAKGEQLTKSLN